MVHTGRNYRLLIVDDDDVDRRNYGKLLTQRAPGCCDVQHAADGASGLQAMRSQRPDCVLLDFALPDMTGLDFLTAAAVGGELPCAFVFITGNGNEAIAVEAMKRGARDYLVKDQVNKNSLWRSVTTAVIQAELCQRLAASRRDLTAANAALEQEAKIRKAAEAELRTATDVAEKANQAKSRFVTMVTHELRTPLNGILGYAQILRLEGGLSDRQEARVSAMMEAGYHLQQMVEGVLDFTSIENGRIQLHPSVVLIFALAEQCIALIAPIATQQGLSLRMLCAHDAPRQVVADAPRLRQVLLNLLGNAVKYTPDGSVELRILPGSAAGGLRIEVADTGPGIAEADRATIFQDFERLSATLSVQGTGMGLPIAARIVGLMGGRIGQTDNPGGGSLFWLELPAGDATLVPVKQPEPAAAIAMPVRKHILLVDDIAMNRDIIGTFLCAAGHTVVLADSGYAAVRLASEQTFDLILMDVRMPEMDGLEATRLIRALPPPYGGVPILALTAHAFDDQVAQCKVAGMDGHIAKPVDYATLAAAVAEKSARGRIQINHVPAPPTPPDTGTPAAPLLDRDILIETLGFLSPGEGAGYLQLLRRRIVEVLRLLDEPASRADLADAVHALGSASGMFGLLALLTVARNLEHLLASDSPATECVERQLRAQAEASLEALDGIVFDNSVQPA
jgi:signal transduction histidine kinase